MAPESARHSRYAVIGGSVLGGAALAYIGLADPHRPGSVFPPCPFRLLTGWYCPGCGGLRMTHDVLHADIAAAVADNVFLLVGLPLVALWWMWRRYRQRPAFPATVVIVLSVATVVWTVARNLPGFPLIPTMLGA